MELQQAIICIIQADQEQRKLQKSAAHMFIIHTYYIWASQEYPSPAMFLNLYKIVARVLRLPQRTAYLNLALRNVSTINYHQDRDH